jgi:hypothetical protein
VHNWQRRRLVPADERYAPGFPGAAMSDLLAQVLEVKRRVIDWASCRWSRKGRPRISLSFFARWSSEG